MSHPITEQGLAVAWRGELQGTGRGMGGGQTQLWEAEGTKYLAFIVHLLHAL